MDIKLIKDQDKIEVMKLWAYSFEDETDPFYDWYFNNFFKAENTLGVYTNDKLLANLQLNPYQLYLRGKVLDTSYIVGIASIPEARGHGIVQNLMKEAFKEMRKREHFICLLMPYRAHFYYPYDFEFTHHHLKYTLPIISLKKLGEKYGEFRPLLERTDYLDLKEVYEKFTSNKHGYIMRSKENWKHLIEEHIRGKGYIYLLTEEDEPQGYLMYYLQENKFIVKEMAYSNIKAQKSLLKYIYNHNSQVEFLEWNASSDDLTHLSLPDPKEGVALYPFMMARIVDVQGALESINYSQDITAKIIIKLTDKLAPWNEGTFQVEVTEGKAKVTKLLEASNQELEQISLEIGALSTLFFGRLSVQELVFLGKIKSDSPEKIEVLNQMFPKTNNFINEYV